MFSDFIKTHFQKTFSRCRIPKSKKFLQAGCPVQNSKKVRQTLDTVGESNLAYLLVHRFYPIENVFHFVKSELRTEAFEKNINYEIFEQFFARVKHTLENTPTKYIDKTIESISKRMLMVIKSKGQRIKY